MAETPNPTDDELADYDSLVNGDIGRAVDEIIRRLKFNLPREVTRANTAKGWTGSKAIRTPSDIQIAPHVLNDSFLNMVLVGVSVDTTAQGIGGAFRNEAQIVIYSIDERIEIDQQVKVAWKRAEAIRTCLMPFLSGCRNAQDQQCWRMLEPKGYSMLPQVWKEYSGTTVIYKLVQSPGQ